MNEQARLAQIIVKAIQEFPKVYKFLVSGDTGCHPQHFVDTIAERIVEENSKMSQKSKLTRSDLAHFADDWIEGRE